MANIQSFRDLDAWQISMKLAEECYAVSATFPAAERFGLRDQLRRAAVSIPSNVAEGHRLKSGLYRKHVRIALGSLAEVETQLELVKRLGLAAAARVAPSEELAGHARRLLFGLLRSIDS